MSRIAREFWEKAACAALNGLIAEGNTPIKDEAAQAAKSADRLMIEWEKRFPGLDGERKSTVK